MGVGRECSKGRGASAMRGAPLPGPAAPQTGCPGLAPVTADLTHVAGHPATWKGVHREELGGLRPWDPPALSTPTPTPTSASASVKWASLLLLCPIFAFLDKKIDRQRDQGLAQT